MRLVIGCAVAAVALVATACANDPTATSSHSQPPSRPNSAADVHATTIACGATLLTDLKLEHDLACSGDAIIVGADDIRVDLNGHTIAGNDVGVGITVRMRQRVTVRGGFVRGFVTGIFVANSTGIEIAHNAVTDTREAIFLNGSSGNVIKNNVAWENQLRGIMLRPTTSGVVSTDNHVVENVLTDNPSGVLLFGQPGNTFTANTISGSSLAAFDLTGGGASGNVIRGNRLLDGAAGVKFGPGWTDNIFLGNTIAGNVCGTQGTTTGNTLQGNNFKENTNDTCP